MGFHIPKTEYETHPAGRFTGRIIEVRDLGLVETQFGDKHKVAAIIETEGIQQANGYPFQVWQKMTLSSNKKAALRKFREAVLDRELTAAEQEDFDPSDLVDRRISYRIDHNEGKDGRVFGNIREGSVEPYRGPVGGDTQVNEDADPAEESEEEIIARAKAALAKIKQQKAGKAVQQNTDDSELPF